MMSHTINRYETSESIMKNEEIFWLECNGKTIASKSFSKEIDQLEIHNWTRVIMEEHAKKCPDKENNK